MELTVLCVTGILSLTKAAEWGYTGSNGLHHWPSSFPSCGKHSQSPIDFPEESEMELDVNLKPMKITGLERTKNYRLELFNNGHSAQVNVDGDVYVEGGGLPNRFQTAQFHFHWGRDDNTGSEHLYSGGSFPLELHVVNYNVKYGNSSNAMTKVGDGLAVLGFWFERSDSDNPFLTPLINKLSSVQNADPSTKVPVSDLDLGKVISGNLDRFYRYSGSLTTPPCYESVIWSVFQTKIPISSSQLTAFRRLKKVPHGGKTTALVDNYRPPKTINGRKISISFPSGVATVSASSYVISIVFCIFLFTIKMT